MSAGKRLAAVATAVSLFATPLAQRAAASPIPGKQRKVITLKGARSGWAEIEFDSKVQMFADETAVTTSGTHVAYALQKKGEDNYRSGAFWFSIFETADDKNLTPQSMSVSEIPAGTYRIYLITDGRSTVRIPISGIDKSIKLKPRNPVKADADVREIEGPSVTDRAPITMRKRSVLVGGMFFASDMHQVTTQEQCLVDPGANECVTEPRGVAATNGATLSAGNTTPGWGLTWLLLGHPQDNEIAAPPGDYEFFQRFAASVALYRERVTFWLQFDLV